MKKLIVLIFLLFVTGLSYSQDKDKFNDTAIEIVEQNQYPNAILYSDSSGNSYLNVTFQITDLGILIGEKGSPFENWILFPTSKTKFLSEDIEDIFTFIKSRDLKNRMK